VKAFRAATSAQPFGDRVASIQAAKDLATWAVGLLTFENYSVSFVHWSPGTDPAGAAFRRAGHHTLLELSAAIQASVLTGVPSLRDAC
jgi:hypothetical protein